MRLFLLICFAFISLLQAYAQVDSPSLKDTVDDKTKELKEVVVKATRPLSNFDADGIVTTIKDTPLQSLESAADVLGYLPGVINNNGSIEVVGKGQPVIYINRRKLVNYSELSQIPAAKVKDVKVINNPGSKYDGSTEAVIRISTIGDPGDGFSLDNRATFGYSNYFYGKDLLNMNYRTSGLDVFAGLEYNNRRTRGSGINTQETWGTHNQTTSIDTRSNKRWQVMDGKIGFNYTPNASHSFGAFYQYIYRPEKTRSDNNTLLSTDGIKEYESKVAESDRERYYSHLVYGYYSGVWGKWTADATFDFLWRKSDKRQDITEAIIGGKDISMHLNDNSHGRMLAGELHFAHPLWKGNIQFGGSYTNSRRSDLFLSDYASIANNDNEIREDNTGVYVQLYQCFGQVMLQAGVRYEHIGSNYFETGKKIAEQSTVYNEVLPSASIVLPIRNVMFQLSYSRKYQRPLYSQLSSTVSYVNQYTYQTGNPNLRSSFIDNLSLNFRYKWLMVMASYKHIKDRIITECMEYEGDPEITLYQKVNSKRAANNLEIIVSMMPGFIGKFYYPTLMAGVVSQFYDIDFKGEVKHMNNPMALVRFNNMFRLPKNYMINLNFNYRSDFDSENIHMRPTMQVDISASKAFGKHLDVRLSFNDIFNTARKSGFTMYSGMREVHTIRYNTMRGVEISIGYRFNTTKSKYKGKGAANEEKNRL